MSDRLHKRSPTPPGQPSTEDPDTAAARKELKQTAISEKPDLSSSASSITSTTATAKATKAKNPADSASRPDKASSKDTTPDRDLSDTPSNNMKDQISSPKKKRVYDEVDELNQTSQDPNGDVSPIGANGRTDRSEPEKKRPRDVSSETKKVSDDANKSTVCFTATINRLLRR